MKTATSRELRNQFPIVAAWLEKGETVLLTRRGRPMGRIIPEPRSGSAADANRHALFSKRFSPLAKTPVRDLSGVLAENRGET